MSFQISMEIKKKSGLDMPAIDSQKKKKWWREETNRSTRNDWILSILPFFRLPASFQPNDDKKEGKAAQIGHGFPLLKKKESLRFPPFLFWYYDAQDAFYSDLTTELCMKGRPFAGIAFLLSYQKGHFFFFFPFHDHLTLRRHHLAKNVK